jgi:thiamine kinase-like enzyme
MKIIRLLLVSVVLLFIVVGLVGALLPSHVLVSRAIDIQSSKASIIHHTNNIAHWKPWMEGLESANVINTDSLHASIAGTKIVITQITDTTVVSSWTNQNGNTQISTIRFIEDTVHNRTIVQWQFEQDLQWYPWEKLGSIMNDKILGPMMEKNLNNLKGLVEKPINN